LSPFHSRDESTNVQSLFQRQSQSELFLLDIPVSGVLKFVSNQPRIPSPCHH
jgi:hypothetical protein